MSFPTPSTAAAGLVTRALDRSQDKLVRLDCGTEFDLDALLKELDPEENYRIGITSPLNETKSRRAGRRLSRNARQITQWRNEPVARRRETPLVILGRASGRDEAGLRRCPIVISEESILREFKAIGVKWLAQHVQATEAPRRLFGSLADMTAEGLLGIGEFESYCQHAFEPPEQAHLRPLKELWRLGLMPDNRAMDGPKLGGRLSLNYEEVERLRSAPANDREEHRLDRLQGAADRGDSTARAALEFAATGRIEHLKDVDFGDFLAILDHKPSQPTPGAHPAGGLLELLEQREASDSIAGLSDAWNTGEKEFADTVELGGARYTISMQAEQEGDDEEGQGDDNQEADGTDDALAESLYLTRRDESDEADTPPYTGAALIRDAKTLDSLTGEGGACEGLARAFVEARHEVLPLAKWDKSLLEVLIISSTERQRAESYRARWAALVGYVLGLKDAAHAGQLRQRLAHLDAEWDYHQAEETIEYRRAQLLPIHPFVLAPHLELAQHAIASIGQRDLSEQLRWALDRSIPAYPAIWIGGKTLLHKGGAPTRPEFAVVDRGARPALNTARGLVDLVRAYVGIHPYTARGLSLLLVDPPEGSGITSALTQIRGLVEDLRTTIVLWHGESLPWDPGAYNVDNMGRIQDLAQWRASQHASYNLVVVFGRPRPASAGSHPGLIGPSRGLQNALMVTVRDPQIVGAGAQSGDQIPCVTIQPRESHDVVQLLMRLARSSEQDDKFFEVRPLLQGHEIEEWASFGQLGDWVAFGAPSPIGLIPPRSLATGLTFLGREELGSYALFVYASDLYSVRRKLTAAIKEVPVSPNPAEVEKQLELLALAVPNGVLRLGRGGANVVNAQIGLMAASHITRKLV